RARPAFGINHARGLIRPVQISRHQMRATEPEFPLLIYAQCAASFGVQNHGLDVRQQPSDRASAVRCVGTAIDIVDGALFSPAVSLPHRAIQTPLAFERDSFALWHGAYRNEVEG